MTVCIYNVHTLRKNSESRRLPNRVSALVEEARVFKAGNSLAIRIPSAVAKKLDFEDGSELEMAVDRGGLWIRRSKPRRPNLRALIDGITPANVHGEVSTGRAIGREVLED